MKECIIFYIIGFVFGILVSYFSKKFETVYGEIEVNDEEESYFFKMSSKDIKDPKNKRVIFKIKHNIDSRQ